MERRNLVSLWQLLGECRIVIPIIQRDYAQGREGKEFLRQRFLASLKRALDDGTADVLSLDFVYGSQQDDQLQPLDGQQRLTTLWLLHWYIALRAEKLAEAGERLRKFSYETRISARRFCEQLCTPANFEAFQPNDHVVGFICQSTWFYSEWRQDPTIQAMLRMLGGTSSNLCDGIEPLFQEVKVDFVRYWNSLVRDEPDPPIRFYRLQLEDFGLTDDLYIKMNARGKQLTPFEHLKADLVGYLRDRADKAERESDESQSEWKMLANDAEGIPHKLDVDWEKLFWSKPRKGMEQEEVERSFDARYYAFLNRFFWNEVVSSGKIELSKGFEDSKAYEGLEPYKYDNELIPIGLFKSLERLLDNYIAYQESGKSLPKCLWESSFEFIPQYKSSGDGKTFALSPINLRERVVFFSLCKYFYEGLGDEVSLARWLRVVWNLVSGQDEEGNDEIRSVEAARRAMKEIDKLNSHSVYESLLQASLYEGKDAFGLRLREEQEKAKQILSEDGKTLRPYCDTTWEDAIIAAERYAFFRRAIRFLFHDDNGQVDWEDFQDKWATVQCYFCETPAGKNESCMQPDWDNATLLKALFSRIERGEFWNVLWWKHKTFNNWPATWLYYLLHEMLKNPVHQLLMGHTDFSMRSTSDDVGERILGLLSSPLMDYIVEDKELPNSWIRWIWRNGQKTRAIHPPWKEGILLECDKRDEFLHSEGIESRQSIEGSKLSYGWDIRFTYKGKQFCWQRDDHVYPLKKDKKRVEKQGQTATSHYYCFDGAKCRDRVEFLKKLDEYAKYAE